MITRQVLSSYTRLTDAELSALAGTVQLAMTGNTNFSEPFPSIPELEAAIADYRMKYEVANRKGSPLDISLKNESRELLLDALKRLAFYVNTIANGVTSILLSSGFPLKALPNPIQVPGIPGRLKLSDGLQRGQMRFDFEPVQYAWEYEYCVSNELAEDGAIIWGDLVTTTSSRANIIAPVTQGIIYRVRVRARNGRGIGDWSEPVWLMAR